MGNICSRSKNEPEAFSRPGRVLGSNAPPSASAAGAPQGKKPAGPRAPLPANSKSHFGSPGRTLGDADAGGENSDARTKAALAAQKRAESSTTGKGKLGSKLAAQKAQTQTQTLNEASRNERAARKADEAAREARWE